MAKWDTDGLQQAFKNVANREGKLPMDKVNSPAHYAHGNIECIDYIKDFLTEDEYIGYLRGNIAKYLHRWRHKNGLEDLKKAEWYLKELIRVQSND